MLAKIDITGQRFGKLIALKPTTKRKHGSIVWKCKCDCGEIKLASLPYLRYFTRSCGCLNSKKSFGDITGKQFGKLIALKPTNKRTKKRSIVWQCLCSCGNICFAGRQYLIEGKVKSCGCLMSLRGCKPKDIKGQRFGRLVVLRMIRERWHGCVTWECKCDCGNTTIATGKVLRIGSTKSCGCLIEASRYVQRTNINPMDVPFEITHLMKARRELDKVIKEAS